MGEHRLATSTAIAVVLIGAGATVAVVRHNRQTDTAVARVAAQSTRYDRLLRRARARPPVFEISFVQFEISDLPRMLRGGTLVTDAVSRQLQVNRPRHRPDFGRASGAVWLDTLGRGVREHRVTPARTWVLAVVVREVAPGAGTTLRMHVDRVTLRSFSSVWDATDFTPPLARREWRAEGRHTPEIVEWRPRTDRSALVPLALLYDLRWRNTPENTDLLDITGSIPGITLVSGAVLLPQTLRLHGSQHDMRLPLRRALDAPLVVGHPNG